MFLEALFVMYACQTVALDSGRGVSLSAWTNRTCVQGSNLTFKGHGRKANWRGVHLTHGIFRARQIGSLTWSQSRISDVYFRDGVADSMIFVNSALNAVDFSLMNIGNLEMSFAEGGGWRMDRSTVTKLSINGVEISGWQSNQIAGDVWTINRAKLKDVAILRSEVSALAITESEIEDLSIQDLTLRQLTLAKVSVKGLRWTGLIASGGRIADSVIKDAEFKDVTLNRFVFENVRFENADLRGLRLGPGSRFVNCTFDEATRRN